MSKKRKIFAWTAIAALLVSPFVLAAVLSSADKANFNDGVTAATFAAGDTFQITEFHRTWQMPGTNMWQTNRQSAVYNCTVAANGTVTAVRDTSVGFKFLSANGTGKTINAARTDALRRIHGVTYSPTTAWDNPPNAPMPPDAFTFKIDDNLFRVHCMT